MEVKVIIAIIVMKKQIVIIMMDRNKIAEERIYG